MSFFRIMFVKEHPYLYRQTNHRQGAKVISQCEYIGRVAGGVPLGVQSRPRPPRDFGEMREPRVDTADPQDRESIRRQIELGIAVAAEKLAREQRRKTRDYDKRERRLYRLEWEIRALRTLAEEVGLWHRL
ncbi:MAG: hypothetical protein ACSLEZ_12850 [Thiobacillus sp.]